MDRLDQFRDGVREVIQREIIVKVDVPIASIYSMRLLIEDLIVEPNDRSPNGEFLCGY